MHWAENFSDAYIADAERLPWCLNNRKQNLGVTCKIEVGLKLSNETKQLNVFSFFLYLVAHGLM